MTRTRTRIATLALALTGSWLCGCSVDEEAHPQWLDEEACEQKQPGTWKYDRGFCYLAVPEPDSDDDAGAEDASDDAGDAAVDASDASPPEPCTTLNETEPCYEGDDPETGLQPPCRAGLRTCYETGWGPCVGQVLPAAADSCDGVDDDCDGTIDEGQVQSSCEVQDEAIRGACKEGLALCDRGSEQCLRVIFPTSETCDGSDQDCDGRVDEGTEVACYPATVGCTQNASGGYDCVPGSTCAPGQRVCDDGELTRECSGAVTPRAEAATGNGETAIDEDCDGRTDEGFNCNTGDTFQCYTGPAGTRYNLPCHGGVRGCLGGVIEATCHGEQKPVPESCANPNSDDDCNGELDDVPLLDGSCADLSDATGSCQEGARWRCVDDSQQCVNADPVDEVCDARGGDEDCDGESDEGFDFDGDPDHCGSCNNRCSDGQSCCGGACVDTRSSNAHCSACGNECGEGLTCCAGGCVDTRTDANNCGSCGTVCGLLGLLKNCTNSACSL